MLNGKIIVTRLNEEQRRGCSASLSLNFKNSHLLFLLLFMSWPKYSSSNNFHETVVAKQGEESHNLIVSVEVTVFLCVHARSIVSVEVTECSCVFMPEALWV
jgi:hypothetical protein